MICRDDSRIIQIVHFIYEGLLVDPISLLFQTDYQP